MALGTFILMAGCSAQTGVVPTGQNSYLVAKQATTGFPGLGNLKAEALQEANQYCVGRGSDLFVTRSTETQPPVRPRQLSQGGDRISLRVTG
jgi:hypothetical protein